MSQPGNVAGTGQQSAFNGNSDYNAVSFMIRQFLATVRGSALVQIVACTSAGDVAAIGTVDVTPLVNQLDGAGNSVPHGTISKLPFMRIQGGKNAVINDPQAGDIGLAVFADRDISAVKATGTRANPGSFRRNDWADGMYVMTVMSKDVPEQYLRFFADGMEMVDKNSNQILMNANGISQTDAFGNVLASGSSGLTYNGKNIGDTHVHTTVQSGSDDSGPPA